MVLHACSATPPTLQGETLVTRDTTPSQSLAEGRVHQTQHQQKVPVTWETPKKQKAENQPPSLLDSLYDTMLTSTSHAQEPEGILEELERYMSEPVIDRKRGNPLE